MPIFVLAGAEAFSVLHDFSITIKFYSEEKKNMTHLMLDITYVGITFIIADSVFKLRIEMLSL